MLQLVRPCSLLQLIKKYHNVTFSRCFSQRICRSVETRLHNHTRTHSIVANSAARHSISSSTCIFRRRGTVHCGTIVRLTSSEKTHHPVQTVCTDTRPGNQSHLSNFDFVKLRSWAFSVDQFGSLSTKTSSSVRITPLNPHDYPDADRAFVHLLLSARGRGDETKRILGAFTGDDGLWKQFMRCDVQYQDDEIRVTGDTLADGGDECVVPKENIDFLWLVEVPMSYDVDSVATGLSTVVVEQLENQTCKVQTAEGDIVTKKLKSDTVNLQSTSGDITCAKLLQGNIVIATGGHGTITADRLQGQEICIHSDSGAIVVKDVYARKSKFKSERGNINLGNLHGDVTVTCEKGDLNIGSLDGSLSADIEKGNVAAYLSKHRDVDINCEQGDICIKVTSDIQTRLNLQASKEIDIPEELETMFAPDSVEGNGELDTKTKRGHLNGGQKSTLSARAEHGSVTLGIQSWFDSLQLTPSRHT